MGHPVCTYSVSLPVPYLILNQQYYCGIKLQNFQMAIKVWNLLLLLLLSGNEKLLLKYQHHIPKQVLLFGELLFFSLCSFPMYLHLE